MSEFVECRKCGAAVLSADKHRRWHAALQQVEAAAAAAEEVADRVANELYRRGLD